MKVATYCRVSTGKEDQANSFEAQKRYFQEYIQRNPDWELYEVYADEGLSGTSTQKRVQFNRMMDDAMNGKFQLIVTKEVSRFSRNVLDTIAHTRELRAIGVGVLFVNDNINTMEADGEFLLTVMASMSQEESRKTSTRVVWGQTRQMEQGVVFGHSMLGYDVKDGRITVNPEGAEIVRMIFHKYALEQIGTSQIARELTAAGYRTNKGSTQWRSNTVVKILKNEKYVGDLVQKKSYTPDYLNHEKKRNTGQVPLIRIENHHEPIVSREIWELTQQRLRKNNKHKEGAVGHSNRHIFSGKIKCGECGSSFVARYKKLQDGTKIRRWNCGKAETQGKDACGVGRLVRDDDAVNMLKTAIRSIPMDTKAVIHDVTNLAANAIQTNEAVSNDKPEYLNYEMEKIQKKKEALLDSFLDGAISREDMQTMKQRYDSQLEALRERLHKAENNTRTPQQIRSSIQEEVRKLLTGELESEVFYKHLLERLTVFKDRHLELKLNHLPMVFQFG